MGYNNLERNSSKNSSSVCSITAELEVSYNHPAADVVVTVLKKEILLETLWLRKTLAIQIYTREASISLAHALSLAPKQYNELI